MSTKASAESFGSQPRKNLENKLLKGNSPKPRWSIIQRADDPDIDRANQQLKEDVAGGADGVALVFEGAHTAYGYGLPRQAETIAKLFENVELNGLHIRFENHPHGRGLIDAFVDYVRHRKIDPARTKLTFSIDPTVVLATTGRLKMSIEALKASLPQSMSGFFSSGLPGIVLEADGRLYHNCGASEAQEIGAMLSVALGHLKMVEEARHHIIYALPHIGFSMSLNQDLFMGLAKIKVLKTLWQRLQKQLGITSPLPASIHVETSMRMMTAQGAENNNTRASLAAQAAIMGEADSVTVLPGSFVFGLPNQEARRIARNIQLIIANENSPHTANLRPSSEADWRSLASAAWDMFEHFEAAGGVLNCLLNGTLAKDIEEARELRKANFIKNDRSIIGVTDFTIPPSKPFGIYDIAQPAFKAEGIKHCQPLTVTRDECDFNETSQLRPY